MLERHKKSITMEKMKEFYKKKFSTFGQQKKHMQGVSLKNIQFLTKCLVFLVPLFVTFFVRTLERGERKQFSGKIYILFCNSSM